MAWLIPIVAVAEWVLPVLELGEAPVVLEVVKDAPMLVRVLKGLRDLEGIVTSVFRWGPQLIDFLNPQGELVPLPAASGVPSPAPDVDLSKLPWPPDDISKLTS